MRISETEAAFLTLLNNHGLRLDQLDATRALDEVLEFYVRQRVVDVDDDSDGDMLLFQWGTYDWGRGRHFEYDLTRQLIGGGGEDEDVWQLSLRLAVSPDAVTDGLGSGNRWCSTPSEIEDFANFVRAVARQPDGTTVSPWAWDRLRGPSASTRR